MTQPTCETCRWWADGGVLSKNTGWCNLLSFIDRKGPLAGVLAALCIPGYGQFVELDGDLIAPAMETHRNFGCVEHEPNGLAESCGTMTTEEAYPC